MRTDKTKTNRHFVQNYLKKFQFLTEIDVTLFWQKYRHFGGPLRQSEAGYNHYSEFDFAEATHLLMKTSFLLLTRFLLSSFMVKSVFFSLFTSIGLPRKS